MELRFVGNYAEVISDYAEFQQFRDAEKNFPPWQAGFTYRKADRIWWCYASQTWKIDDLRRFCNCAALAGFPGLTEPEEGSPNEIGEVDSSPIAPPATYTIVWSEEDYTTIRLEEPWEGCKVSPGTLVLSVLTGCDNTSDFTKIGFVDMKCEVNIWQRASGQDWTKAIESCQVLAQGGLEAQQECRECYALRSGKCACCGRVLTVPASLHRGLGPTCANKF